MKVVLFPHLQKGCAPSVAQKMCLALHRNGMEVLVDPVCQELLQDMPFIQYGLYLSLKISVNIQNNVFTLI